MQTCNFAELVRRKQGLAHKVRPSKTHIVVMLISVQFTVITTHITMFFSQNASSERAFHVKCQIEFPLNQTHSFDSHFLRKELSTRVKWKSVVVITFINVEIVSRPHNMRVPTVAQGHYY